MSAEPPGSVLCCLTSIWGNFLSLLFQVFFSVPFSLFFFSSISITHTLHLFYLCHSCLIFWSCFFLPVLFSLLLSFRALSLGYPPVQDSLLSHVQSTNKARGAFVISVTTFLISGLSFLFLFECHFSACLAHLLVHAVCFIHHSPSILTTVALNSWSENSDISAKSTLVLCLLCLFWLCFLPFSWPCHFFLDNQACLGKRKSCD